jgi:hypothetical protein
MDLRNVGILQHYTASQPRRPRPVASVTSIRETRGSNTGRDKLSCLKYFRTFSKSLQGIFRNILHWLLQNSSSSRYLIKSETTSALHRAINSTSGRSGVCIIRFEGQHINYESRNAPLKKTPCNVSKVGCIGIACMQT